MSATDPAPVYIWFDMEFTDLDPERAAILQVALWITDVQLQPLEEGDRGVNCHVRLAPDAPVSAWVAENLADLLTRCRGPAAVPPATVEGVLIDYIDQRIGPPATDIRQRPVLAGNSVHNDWRLAARHYPRLIDRLHYRLLDISTLKQQWVGWLGRPEFDKEDTELVGQWLPHAPVPLQGQRHDAFYDILASISELHYYRENWLGKHS